MNENALLHIPNSSIIYSAEQELAKLRLASTDDEIVDLIRHYQAAGDTLDQEIAAFDQKARGNKQHGPFRCKVLEHHVYTAILLFADYSRLKHKAFLTLQDVQAWLPKLEAVERDLRYDDKVFVVENLFIPKIKVFLLALKSHLLTRVNADPVVIMSSASQFATEMQAYIHTAKKIHAQGIPAASAMINDALLLFSYAERNIYHSEWNFFIGTLAEHVFGHIMVHEEFSEENRETINHFRRSFSGKDFTGDVESHVVELMGKNVTISLLGVSAFRYSKTQDETSRFLELLCEYTLVAQFSGKKEKEARAVLPRFRALVAQVQREPKLYVFARAMLTHTLVLAKVSPTEIMSSVIQLFCDMKQEEVTPKSASDQWNDCVAEIVFRSVFYLMSSDQFSKEDKAFLGKPKPAVLASELLKFDFPAFAQRIRRAIAIALLYKHTEMDKSIEKDALLIGQLKFTHLCFADERVSTLLKEFSALLNAYRYFTGSMSLSFLDGPTDERFTDAMHTVQTSDVSRYYLSDMTRDFSALKDFSVMATFFLFCNKALSQPDPKLKKECENILWTYAHNTIVFLCEIEIQRIKDAIATGNIVTLIAEYKTRRTKCSKIDSYIYSTLLLYIDYSTLDLPNNVVSWEKHSQEVLQQLQPDDKDLSSMDKIFTHRLRICVLALSAHAHTLTKSTFTAVKSTLLNTLCELTKMRPYVATNPVNFGFYTKAMGVFKCWEDDSLRLMDATLESIHTDSDASPTDKAFFEYYKNGTEVTPESFASRSSLLSFDYRAFAREIEIEIARVLLSKTPETHMNKKIEENMFLMGQLLFLKLQMMHSNTTGKIPAEIQKRLDTVLPLLYLYRYLLQSPSCYINVDVDEQNEFTFFNRLSMKKNIDITEGHKKLIYVCFLIEAAENKEPLLKKLVVKKSKVPSLSDTTLQTLSALFTKPQACASVVRNYFITIEKFKWHFESVSLKAAFFLICKITLALNNPELTALAERNLRAFQGIQTVEQKLTIEEQLANISSVPAPKPEAKKKKKSNNKKKKKDKKSVAVEAQAEGAPAVMSVVSVVSSVSAAEGCSEPEPDPDTLLTYLLRTGCRKEKLEEPSAEQTLIFTLKKRLADFFNAKSHAQNQFKYTLGGYGSQQLRQKFFTYPVSINDLDFVINCNFEELQTLLETHKTELHIAQIVPLSHLKYPIIIISFEEDPNFYVDITPLHRPTTPLTWSLFRVFKEKQATLDFPPNAIFSVIVDGWEFFVDTQHGLDVLEKGPRELRLISTAMPPDEIAQMILRSIKFLAKCPDFTPSRELLDWFAENQGTLSTYAALNPFAKLLFSGVAMRSLALLNEFGLLKSLLPILIPLMAKEEFTTWVKAFDTYDSPGYKLEARKNYRQTFCRVLAEFLYLTRDSISLKRLPHEIPRQDRKIIKRRWEEKKKYESLEFFPPAPEPISHPGQQGESCYTSPTTNMGSSKNGDGN